MGEPYGAAAALAAVGWNDMVNAGGERAGQYLDEAVERRRRYVDAIVRRTHDAPVASAADPPCHAVIAQDVHPG